MTTQIYFSKFLVTSQVFYKSRYTFALVNLKPLVPGHVLIVPLRTSVVHLADLTPEESSDYFRTLQTVHQFIKHEFKADSLNVAIQDGPEAGQTVPHLHTHIIPRYRVNNIGDKIYEKLDEWSFEDQLDDWQQRHKEYVSVGGRNGRKQLGKPDVEREPRSNEEMYQEANALSEKLKLFLQEYPHLK